MNKVFDEFWDDPFLSYSYEFPSIREFDTFMPSTNIGHYTTEDEVIIKAKLPIEEKSGVNVTITDDGVSIKSIQKKQTKKTKDNLYQEEVQSQQFYRYLALPENADTDKATPGL